MGHNIVRMFSRAGTVSPYLWMQEGHIVTGIGSGPVPIPTIKIRGSAGIKKAIRKKYRVGKSEKFNPGDFGTPGNTRTFIGKPRGKNRRFGIYEGASRNKRLKMLRNLEHRQVKIKDTNFHNDAVKKYGTVQFIRSQFYKAAKKRLARR